MTPDRDHKKYGSVTKGRSAEQLANYNRDISPAKSEALKRAKGGKLKTPYKDRTPMAKKMGDSYIGKGGNPYTGHK